jgi:uncharacterized membrane protein (UPF0127 family)
MPSAAAYPDVEMRRAFAHVPSVKFFQLTSLLLVFVAASCHDAKQNTAAAAQTSPATNASEPPPPFLMHAQPKLQTTKLFVGANELTSELALRPTEIYTGMMWRTNMPENEGMLFVFPDASPRSFYMKNTYVPLSLAYIDTEGVIQEIHDLQPRNETPVPSKADNIQFVLEVPQGWFKRHNVAPGTVVRSEQGELKKIFRFSPR